jgi:mRNA interferase RelE/StbE
MNVEIKESFFKDIKDVPDKIKDQIIDAIEALENSKSLSENSNLLKMEGKENEFRMKVGRYRVLLSWEKRSQILWVFGVAHRQNIYKK